MIQRSNYYIRFLVAFLWVATDNTVCVRGLQVSNGNNPNVKNNNYHPSLLLTKNSVYITTSSGSRCFSPGIRVVPPVKADYKQEPIDGGGVVRDYFVIPASLRLIPLQASSSPSSSSSSSFALKSLQIASNEDKTPSIIHHSKHGALAISSSSIPSSKVPPSSVVNLGCALAANSGFLNGLGMSGILGRAACVAAVTGTYTNAALAFSASPQASALLAVLLTPLCYMLGSVLNGALNPDGPPRDIANLSLLESSPLILAGLIVLLANALNSRMINSAPTFCLLIFCMGLQNSFTTNMVQCHLLRTTHFSGITSDIGTALGQLLRGNKSNAYRLPVFLKLTASFWAGGMISILGVKRWGMAASTGCRLSALFYLALWYAWTAPIREGVAHLAYHCMRICHLAIYRHPFHRPRSDNLSSPALAWSIFGGSKSKQQI